ncbi:MAG: hypothetical protein JWO79_1837 [Actinomycetia bacterium]|nr:hypothetical protein [Actinomycetes bacterium]
MTRAESDLVKAQFRVETDEDGWPPVASEGLWGALARWSRPAGEHSVDRPRRRRWRCGPDRDRRGRPAPLGRGGRAVGAPGNPTSGGSNRWPSLTGTPGAPARSRRSCSGCSTVLGAAATPRPRCPPPSASGCRTPPNAQAWSGGASRRAPNPPGPPPRSLIAAVLQAGYRRATAEETLIAERPATGTTTKAAERAHRAADREMHARALAAIKAGVSSGTLAPAADFPYLR